jgi:hypothetical protein
MEFILGIILLGVLMLGFAAHFNNKNRDQEKEQP